MIEYRRFFYPGATWFFTVNLAERRGNRLLVDHIDILREAFAHVKNNSPFEIDAIVVLPEHLHCVLTLPEEERRFFHATGYRQSQFFPQHRSGRARF